jgi:hypothetical protein
MLFQRRIDVTEIGIERRTKTIHGRDDHNRDSTGENTVFDRGRARFIGQKLQDSTLQARLLLGCVEFDRAGSKYRKQSKGD